MKFYFLLSVILVITACDDADLPRDAFLPEANGQHGEIFILMENNLWNGDIGKAVKENLSRRAEGPYLRAEPMFNFIQKTSDGFNHVNQMNRNILKFMIDYDSTYAETAVIELENYYAKSQIFIVVKDSDPNRLIDFAKNKMDPIIDRFNEFELNQLIRTYKSESNKRVKELAENKFHISISVPKKAKIKFEADNFLLIKRDRSKNLMGNESTGAKGGTFWVQQGFMIWTDPYFADSNQLTITNVLKNRDTILKYNVPGSSKDTYMGTEYSEYYEPEGKVFSYKGHQAVEIRGLWKYKGEGFASGGGPFMQYSILNEANNEIVTVCGYVYGPKYDKREFIRELEAVLNTIEIK